MNGTGPAVTIAGGGLSGLTAAIRLAERGYRITLYEQKSWLGGNLGSRPMDDGEYLDVYPHMYLEWYANFWALLEEATQQPKETRFAPFSSVKQLSKKAFPAFAELTDMYSPWHMIQNMFSGVGPPADMFVFGYASIDLLADLVLDPAKVPADAGREAARVAEGTAGAAGADERTAGADEGPAGAFGMRKFL
jgi:uncharacterized protein with NAD-binding domain and iron-sulfur cluster